MTSTTMLSTSDAYLLAQDRGFDGSKEQLRMMARETPKILEAEYGLAYSSTPEFSRNAKNWEDMRPEEPRPVNLSEKNGKKGKRAAVNNAPKTSSKISLLPNASSSNSSNPPTMTDIQNIAELAQVLTWFTQEVDQLRQRLNSLQSNGAVATDSSAVNQLQSENESLRAENASLRDKLNHVQQALGIADDEPAPVAIASPPSSKPSPAPTARKKPGKRGRKPTRGRKPSSTKAAPSSSSSDLDPNVNLALEAIFNYNNQSDLDKEDKWAVSYPVMKDLLKQVGAATQPKIKQVFDARRKEIDRHHQSHGLSSRHNRVHGDRSISDFIQLKGK
jgi:hypothetical protein